jgi:TRAP-type mannitol/chloroaromatic compound transport system permease small subunit
MGALKKIVGVVDFMSEKSGQVGKWAALGLVLVGAYDTISRHFFNAPSDWAYDMMCMFGGAMYLLGASYNMRFNAHTRVDIFFNMLKPKAKAIVNLVATLLFFFPLVGMMLYEGVKWSIKAVKVNEVMFTSFWYPPAAPYRILFAIGIFLLFIQGLANLAKNIIFLARGEKID